MHLCAMLAVVVYSRSLLEAMGELMVGELSLFYRSSVAATWAWVFFFV